MDTKTIKIVSIILITSIILFFSGKHLMIISEVNTLYDGLMVMLFFLSLFPFLSLSAVLFFKILKSFSRIKLF
ncbi:hypothetical protein [Polaribacter sp. KT25b]|uniref:hypothetical protein n=1 Tax=Polaribacter sp. KT25b TaxID=1855336 RepID=UPI0012FE6985|nr:hypothetical protein [Polaribacter sp. KT25b]